MTFVAQIKADASGFTQTVDQAVAKLTGLETKARTAGETATTAFDKAGGSTESLNDKLSGVAGAFDKLSQAIKREQDMLAAIRGPVQQYEQQLQTLDSLLGKNAISTEEYAAQVEKLNAQLERQSSIRMAPAPQMNQAEESGGVNGLLMAGSEAFLGYEGVRKFKEYSDSYTELSNKLRVVSKDQTDLNSVMDQTYKIAQDTRSSWDATATMYQRLANVTGDLGLSEQQVLDLTKEISEAAKISGASQYEAQMAMMELTHAFAMGSLQGRQFKTMLRDMPTMMHELQVASGMTQEAFAEMGEKGQITAANLAQWFDAAGGSIDEKFQHTQTTFGEVETEIGNHAKALAGTVRDAFAQTYNDEKSLIDTIDEAFGETSLRQYQEAYNLFNQSIDASKQAIAAAQNVNKIMREERGEWLQWDGVIQGTIHNLKNGTSVVDAFGDALSYLSGKVATAVKAHEDAAKSAKKHHDAIHALTPLEQAEKSILDSLHGPSERYNLDVAALGELLDHNKISVAEYITKLHELSDAYNKSDTALKMAALSARGGITGQLGYQVAAPQAGPTSLPYETATGFAFPAEQQDPAKLTEAWNKDLEKYTQSVKKTEEQLSKLFEPLVNGINEFFRTGQVNMQQLGASILDTIEQIIVKEAEMWAMSKLASALTPAPNVFGAGGPLSGSVFGALLGGLPGFATGGDVTVGGSGGTDSQLFMARVSPNENISIRRPDQMEAQRQPDTRPVQVIVQDGGDPRAITAAFASREFERQVLRITRKHRN